MADLTNADHLFTRTGQPDFRQVLKHQARVVNALAAIPLPPHSVGRMPPSPPTPITAPTQGFNWSHPATLQ